MQHMKDLLEEKREELSKVIEVACKHILNNFSRIAACFRRNV